MGHAKARFLRSGPKTSPCAVLLSLTGVSLSGPENGKALRRRRPYHYDHEERWMQDRRPEDRGLHVVRVAQTGIRKLRRVRELDRCRRHNSGEGRNNPVYAKLVSLGY